MDIIEKYNKTAEEYAKNRIGSEDKPELNKFKELLKAGKVLDAGCAAGRDTHILKTMGFDALGCDLAKKLLAIARETHPDIEFIYADIRKTPFDDQSLDGVWASAVLHHIPREEMLDTLKEFHRILRQGGLLYVHTKNGKGKMQTEEKIVKGQVREFECISLEELDKMLTKIGFTEELSYDKPSKSRPGLSWVTAFYRKK